MQEKKPKIVRIVLKCKHRMSERKFRSPIDGAVIVFMINFEASSKYMFRQRNKNFLLCVVRHQLFTKIYYLCLGNYV